MPYHGILHGGGDKIVLAEFASAVKKGSAEGLLIAADTCLESHLVGFAAEKARRENIVVNMAEFRKEAAASSPAEGV